MTLKYRLLIIVLLGSWLCFTLSVTQAAYGWLPTDDPVPFYYQQAGRWYQTEDTKMFMVALDGRTYKYIFTLDGSFIGGWVTDMPVQVR